MHGHLPRPSACPGVCLPAALSTASPDISTLRKRITGTLELTARLCCSRLLASCAEMARCAGRSLKALARVGACSSLMSRGVDAAFRKATCRAQGRDTVWCMYCKPYVLDAHFMRCVLVCRHSCYWLQRLKATTTTYPPAL